MKSCKKSFDRFRNLLIILGRLCDTFIHSMSLQFVIVSEQLNYIKTRRFHAIFMPVIIEFSRCIGTYLSAKFEFIKSNIPSIKMISIRQRKHPDTGDYFIAKN